MCEGAGKPRGALAALSSSLEGIAAVSAGGGLVARATAASGTGGAEGGSLFADPASRTGLGEGGGERGQDEFHMHVWGNSEMTIYLCLLV